MDYKCELVDRGGSEKRCARIEVKMWELLKWLEAYNPQKWKGNNRDSLSTAFGRQPGL